MKYQTKKICALLLIFLAIAPFSTWADNSNLASASGSGPTISSADMRKLLNTIAIIKQYYVQPVDDDKLIADAIRGMATGLDPHSAYLGEDDLKALNVIATGELEGIGISVVAETNALKVISPIDGSPAQKAGIRPGDLIVQINNELIKDLDPDKAISLMRGPKGSKVTIYIAREKETKLLKFTLTRNIIKIPTVSDKLYDEHYGYIRISIFQENTPQLVNNALKDLKRQSDDKLFGLIVDVRNNPGGLLESAVDTSGLFLDSAHLQDNKLVTYIKGTTSTEPYNFSVKPNEITAGIPTVVLINDGSASGSEILAGALQDHHRAVILGTKSFGKGSVQTVIPLDKNSALKLTTALYYTPLGRSIQAKGIIPDVLVEDLQLTAKGGDKDQDITAIYEANLPNHLQNGDKNSAPDADPKTKDMVYKDFQLYSALNLLKALKK